MTDMIKVDRKMLEEIMNEHMTKLVLDGIARYDGRYIGNVAEKEARKMFPEMFKDD